MKPLAGAVIGLGQIGQGYDYNLDPERFVLTHATSFACHPGFDLVAGVDPDAAQRTRFEQKFGKPAYADLPSLQQRHQIDVFAIGTPTTAHFATFCAVLEAKPRAIICEKPIATTGADARQMVARGEAAGCALLVNYMRRFEPGGLTLKSLIQKKELGEIYKGVVHGFVNMGRVIPEALQAHDDAGRALRQAFSRLL
jgi:predicted dehydrogenase